MEAQVSLGLGGGALDGTQRCTAGPRIGLVFGFQTGVQNVLRGCTVGLLFGGLIGSRIEPWNLSRV